MDRLNTDQARKLTEAVRPTGGYLRRLADRMTQTNLRLRDPRLYRLVAAANEALHALWVELHYQSCGHGVGRSDSGGSTGTNAGGSP
jgi:hypothetical protein